MNPTNSHSNRRIWITTALIAMVLSSIVAVLLRTPVPLPVTIQYLATETNVYHDANCYIPKFSVTNHTHNPISVTVHIEAKEGNIWVDQKTMVWLKKTNGPTYTPLVRTNWNVDLGPHGSTTWRPYIDANLYKPVPFRVSGQVITEMTGIRALFEQLRNRIGLSDQRIVHSAVVVGRTKRIKRIVYSTPRLFTTDAFEPVAAKP